MRLPPEKPAPLGDGREAVRWLVARAEITDLVTRFAICLDTRDWSQFRALLDDPIEMDYPLSSASGTYALDDLMRLAESTFNRLDATQHISANHQINIDGNEATCVSTLHAQHYLTSEGDPPVQRQIGYYFNYLRRSDRWRIWRSEQHVSWMDGNHSVYEQMFHGSRVRRPS